MRSFYVVCLDVGQLLFLCHFENGADAAHVGFDVVVQLSGSSQQSYLILVHLTQAVE